MMPKKRINSKQKGNRWERECAKFLQRWWPEARRQTYDQSRRGNEQPDVMGTPFWVECKAYNGATKGQIKKWVNKAVSDAGGQPFLIMVRDTKKRQSFIIRQADFGDTIQISFEAFQLSKDAETK
jgi:Holliday junction resolvase